MWTQENRGDAQQGKGMDRHDVRKNWDCIQPFGTGAEQVLSRGALKEQGQEQRGYRRRRRVLSQEGQKWW